MKNSNLLKARKAKDDEFYTLYETVEKEIPFYKEALKGKIIYCPCDDFRESNFVKYLKDNFQGLGLKKLISTNYDTGKGAWKYIYDGTTEAYEELQGNGDYNSPECCCLRDSADVIITNPPFSKFRDFYSWAKVKKILLVCTITIFIYKEIFLDLYAKKVWPGCSMRGTQCLFRHNNGNKEINGVKYAALPNAAWITNMIPENYTPPKLPLIGKTYNPTDYPKYDNYDAIEVSKVKDIPVDYEDVMGVPITILKYYNPYTNTIDVEYEIVGKGGDKDWSENECEFYEKPDDEEINKLKGIDKTFREQNHYITDDSGSPKTFFTRFFIKGAAVSALDGYVESGYINGKKVFARLMIKEKKNGNS